MQAFLYTLLGIALLFLYLLLRYLWIVSGLKDSNSGGVQHSARLEPTRLSEEPFLPGSRAGMEDSVARIKEEMSRGLKIQTFKKRGNSRRPFNTKADIRRSYIIDAILERPKWDKRRDNEH